MQQTISETHPFQCPHCGFLSMVVMHTTNSQDAIIQIQSQPPNHSYVDVEYGSATPVLKEDIEAFVHPEESTLSLADRIEAAAEVEHYRSRR